MASYKSISITFGNALAQAQKLESSAEQMRNASQKLESIEASLRSEWEGESASLYLQKCEMLKQKLNRTAKELQQIASVIRKAAKAYRDAELKALHAIATKGNG